MHSILTVDDTVMNNKIMQLLLEDTGAKIYCTMDAENCINFLEQQIPDVILLDHMMPKVDGLACLKQIRNSDKLYKNVPVIMLTGNKGEEYTKAYEEAGANGYLEKPVMKDKLVYKLKQIFETIEE